MELKKKKMYMTGLDCYCTTVFSTAKQSYGTVKNNSAVVFIAAQYALLLKSLSYCTTVTTMYIKIFYIYP